MKLRIDVRQDLDRDMAKEQAAGERAVTLAMRRAQNDLKGNWRAQVTSAGLGQRLANTIRGETYPKGDVSLNAASLVWTRAPKLIAAYEKGILIRSAEGFWLAIPTEAAGVGRRNRRMTPGEWEKRHGMRLRFVYRKGRTALLVADDARVNARGNARRKGGKRRRDGILTGAQTIVVFILVPQARLRKRLDLMKAADAAAARLPGLILSNWPEV